LGKPFESFYLFIQNISGLPLGQENAMMFRSAAVLHVSPKLREATDMPKFYLAWNLYEMIKLTLLFFYSSLSP
jgi:hypothetical protein